VKILSKLFIVITSIALAFSTTACGTGSQKSSGHVVQLVYWNMWTSTWETLVGKLVDQFNAAHPNIHVTMLSVPSNADTKLLTAIASGDPPDVFTEWNPTLGEYAQRDAILPLDQFMVGKYSGLKDWLYPIVNKYGSYNGKLYGLGMSMNTFMLFYNKEMFQQAGLDPNKPPKTIAQLDADQSKLWKIDSQGTIHRIGFYPSWYEVWAPTWNVKMYQGGKYDMNNSNALKLMDWLNWYGKQYPATQVNAFTSNFGNATAGDPFVGGEEAFQINGMWELPTITQYAPHLKYGVTPLPAPPGGQNNSTWVNGNFNIIPKFSKHPKEAFEFIAWMAGYDNQQWAAKSLPLGGWIPASPKIAELPAYQQFLDGNPYRKEFAAIMNSPGDDITPITPAQQFYETKLGDAASSVLEQKKSPAQALSGAQKEVQDEYSTDMKSPY